MTHKTRKLSPQTRVIAKRAAQVAAARLAQHEVHLACPNCGRKYAGAVRLTAHVRKTHIRNVFAVENLFRQAPPVPELHLGPPADDLYRSQFTRSIGPGLTCYG